ncbi:MAG: acyl-CoA dehydratase activase [Desulfotomaculum sp.]|nr:acyl-CoA dehydratase activase [Desulfotomaculum sp.]
MYSLGIDTGYSAVKISLITSDGRAVYNKYLLHKGKTRAVLYHLITEMLRQYNIAEINYGLITGSGKDFLAAIPGIEFANELSATIEGSLHLEPAIRSIIEIGGQGAKYITEFTNNNKAGIKIAINSNCAAGTGSFLEEQVARLNIALADYSAYTAKATTIPRIAGRCSVFAKTDIIHHQQEGTSVADILQGLAYALVRNYKGTVIKKLPIRKPVAFVGGVACNHSIIKAIGAVLALKPADLIVPEHFANAGAIGAALIAARENTKINLKALADLSSDQKINIKNDLSLPKLIDYGNSDGVDKHHCQKINIKKQQSKIKTYLGIDVGSTSTNIVVSNENGVIISYRYLRTRGDPAQVIRAGFADLQVELGDDIVVAGVGVTGSGRYLIGKLTGADVVKDEITAQAKAAVNIDKTVDTIFEIGGQDSKFIQISNGKVVDFAMNKICAAGTGSFIEEQANKLTIALNDFGALALAAKNPVYLGERCTVFIETNVAESLSRGVGRADLAAGLCHAIVKNYLNKVVGTKKVGQKIFLQGAIAYNQGVVNAFRADLGSVANSEAKIIVPPFFSVTGAWGVALLAQEELRQTKTKSLRMEEAPFFLATETAPAKPSLKMVTPDEPDNDVIDVYKETEKLFLAGYTGEIDPAKETVGIPRVLFIHKLFPMFNVFFKQLGFNVILSDQTSAETVQLSQQYALAETCYPVKLINGHVAQLVQKNVDYIFLPSLYTMKHPASKVRVDYACVYMQSAPKLLSQAINLKQEGIRLLSPALSFKFGKKYMMKTLLNLGAELGKGKIKTMLAIQKGMAALNEFSAETEKIGSALAATIKPGEKVFVIITRPYGVYDPVLNINIPAKLQAMGYKVLTLSGLPAYDHDTSPEYPNMYWPFGQHILSGVQIIKQHPQMYAIYFTNHGCGPDTLLAHYVKSEMGDKPYLHIEVDEHASDVGVITRIEAFINSIPTPAAPVVLKKDLKTYSGMVQHRTVNIKNSLAALSANSTLYLPPLYPYTEIFKELLLSRGIQAEKMVATNQLILDSGRKFTITKEYFSLTALLGGVFEQINQSKALKTKAAFLILKSEGAETSGQYDRLLRVKLDEYGYRDAEIIAPFVEDLLLGEPENASLICEGLLAGDIIRIAARPDRERYLKQVLSLIKKDNFNHQTRQDLAAQVAKELSEANQQKRLFAIGEPLILYNDFMNNATFKKIETSGYRVRYAPLSELMWFIWTDFANQSATGDAINKKERQHLETRLKQLTADINNLAVILAEHSPFENNLKVLTDRADRSIKYYAGGGGRYRLAKLLGVSNQADGIITAASMYENTGTILEMLYPGFAKERLKPVLDLTFDGNINKNDEVKVQSFLYYI